MSRSLADWLSYLEQLHPSAIDMGLLVARHIAHIENGGSRLIANQGGGSAGRQAAESGFFSSCHGGLQGEKRG